MQKDFFEIFFISGRFSALKFEISLINTEISFLSQFLTLGTRGKIFTNQVLDQPISWIYLDQKVNRENLNAYNIYVFVIYVIGRGNKECWVNR